MADTQLLLHNFDDCSRCKDIKGNMKVVNHWSVTGKDATTIRADSCEYWNSYVDFEELN